MVIVAIGMIWCYIKNYKRHLALLIEKKIHTFHIKLFQVKRNLPNFERIHRRLKRKLDSTSGFERLVFCAIVFIEILVLVRLGTQLFLAVSLAITALISYFREYFVAVILSIIAIVIFLEEFIVFVGYYSCFYAYSIIVFHPVYYTVRFLDHLSHGNGIETACVIIGIIAILIYLL